jgi:DNA recombination protein RmuC
VSALQVILVAAGALLLGAAAGWILAVARAAGVRAALAAERERRGELVAELAALRDAKERSVRDLAAARERSETAEGFLARARQELRDSFDALAAEALKGNRDEFLKLADRDHEERRHRIESMLDPLKDALKGLEARTKEMELAREGAYGDLKGQLRGLLDATSKLQEKTTSLASALRGSQTQGRWGEIALRNIVELAGMLEHVDFEEQQQTPDGKRPDMVVRLPGERFLAVDAKVPFNAYMDANEAVTEEARDAALDRHVQALRNHVRTLAARDYAQNVKGDVDLVVLFLPGDPFLSAAFERDPELQVESLRSRVLLATPTTLLALLRTVAIYWQQKSLAENAEKIAEVARTLYDRSAVFSEHLGKVGKGLKAAVEAYNDAEGSFMRRLLPMHRQLEELKAAEGASRVLEPPAPVEIAPRDLEERVEQEDDRIGRLF